jgi:hypothetical protein
MLINSVSVVEDRVEEDGSVRITLKTGEGRYATLSVSPNLMNRAP